MADRHSGFHSLFHSITALVLVLLSSATTEGIAQPPPFLFTLATGLAEPSGLALDPTESYLYVANKDAQAVAKYTVNGAPVTSWGVGGSAYDVAADGAGNVYVLNTTTHQIRKYTSGGQLIRTISFPAGRNSIDAAGLTVDTLGRIHVGANRVVTPVGPVYLLMDSTGVVLREISTTGGAMDFAVDQNLGVWMITSVPWIARYDSAGVFLGSFGSSGSGNGQFLNARRLAFGPDSLLYVPDISLGRVQTFTKSGAYQFQWSVSSSSGIVVDGSRNVYVTRHNIGWVEKYGDPVPLALSVTPADTLMTSGTIGGPFTGSRQFRILNTGADSVSFAAVPQQTWIQVSGAASGSLAPGDSAFVTAVIGSEANILGLGTHVGSVRFEQTNPIPTPAPTGLDRYIRLTVTPPPVHVLDLAVTPVDSVFSQGYAGGPFTPPSANYTITNNGTDSTSYAISESSPWLNLTGSLTGRLPAGGMAQVTAVLTGSAAALTPGRYITPLDVQQTNPVPNQGPTGLARYFVLDVDVVPPSALQAEAGDFLSSGPVGGPFAPATRSYWITTSSASPISFDVSTTDPWVTVMGDTSGIVMAGDTAFVSVHVSAAANSLPEGLHHASVVISQTSPQALPTIRSVYLTAGNPPTLEVNTIVPSSGITTAFAGGTPDTVLLVGTLLGPAVGVDFGGRPATVVWSSANEDSLRVVLPWHPPGADCAGAVTIPVTVTVTVGPFQDTIPFTYTIVKHLVPETYASIQAAINASRPGVCVSVAPGTYLENLLFGAGVSGITVTSRTQDLGETTIQGGGDFMPVNPSVTFDGTGAETILTGFQIILGNTGVVVKSGAAPSIIRNFINNNYALGDGGGVRVEAGCSPLLSNNRIDLNSAVGNGGGLSVTNGDPVLDDNNFNLNVAQGDGGGLYFNSAVPVLLYDIRLFGNAAGGAGGGAYLQSTEDLTATGLSVVGNGAFGTGGGVHCVSESRSVMLSSLQIDGNRSEAKGGGCYVDAASGSGIVMGSTISNNLALYEGGGIYLAAGTDVVVRGCLVNSNAADSSHAGGIHVPDGVLIDITSNSIRDNLARSCGSRGGGIHIPNFVVGDIDSNLIAGNDAWVGGGVSFGRKCRIDATRNVVAYNTAPGDTCFLHQRATGAESMLDTGDTVSVAPGILVDDSGVNIINNTIHGNQQGSGGPHGGGIHGRRTGAYAPDWINNIVSNNSGWGIHAVGVNTAAVIDYNLGYQNGLGNFSPTIQIPGEPMFSHNLSGNPLYVAPAPGTLDFHLASVSSPAVDSGVGPDDPDNTPTDIGAFHFDQILGAVPGGDPNRAPLRVLSVTPNPFRRDVVIAVETDRPVPVTIEVFDVSGRRLIDRRLDLSPGIHNLKWDGNSENGVRARTGIYFCRLQSGGWRHVDKLVLLR